MKLVEGDNNKNSDKDIIIELILLQLISHKILTNLINIQYNKDI